MIAFVTAWLIAGVLIGSVAFFVEAWHLEGITALQDAAIATSCATTLLLMGRLWGPGLRASDEDPLGDWIVTYLGDDDVLAVLRLQLAFDVLDHGVDF